MNGFLVLVRCGIDDIPVRLCPTFGQAVEAAKSLRLADMKKILQRLALDTSIYHGIDVMEFDEDGDLVAVYPIRDFDDEPDCEFPDGSQFDAIDTRLKESEVPPA